MASSWPTVTVRSMVAGSSGSARTPGDVGEEDELLGLEGRGHGAGDGVGVDVVGLTGGVGGDGGHHRDETLGQEASDEGRVDAFDVAHETEFPGPGHGRDQVGVFTRQADGQRRRGR